MADIVDIGAIAVNVDMQLRDRFGRFREILDASGDAAAEALAERLASYARQFAPKGPPRRDYGRAPILGPSLTARMVTGRTGIITSPARHALSQQHGARPHFIPGGLGLDPGVWHPGNPATRYIEQAAAALKGHARALLEVYYPY